MRGPDLESERSGEGRDREISLSPLDRVVVGGGVCLRGLGLASTRGGSLWEAGVGKTPQNAGELPAPRREHPVQLALHRQNRVP